MAEDLQNRDHPSAATGFEPDHDRLRPLTPPDDRDGVGKLGRVVLAVHPNQRVPGRERPTLATDRLLEHRPQRWRADPFELGDAPASGLDLE
jgi:hypothetical protein